MSSIFHARSVCSLPDSGAWSSGRTLTWRHEGKLFFVSPRMMLCRPSRGRVVERVEKFISGEWSVLVGIKPSAGEDDNNPMTLIAVWSLVQMRIFRREAGIGGCCCRIWDSTNVGHVAGHVAAIPSHIVFSLRICWSWTSSISGNASIQPPQDHPA